MPGNLSNKVSATGYPPIDEHSSDGSVAGLADDEQFGKHFVATRQRQKAALSNVGYLGISVAHWLRSKEIRHMCSVD